MFKAGSYVTEVISHGEHLVLLFILSFLLYFVTFAAQVTSLCCAFTQWSINRILSCHKTKQCHNTGQSPRKRSNFHLI